MRPGLSKLMTQRDRCLLRPQPAIQDRWLTHLNALITTSFAISASVSRIAVAIVAIIRNILYKCHNNSNTIMQTSYEAGSILAGRRETSHGFKATVITHVATWTLTEEGVVTIGAGASIHTRAGATLLQVYFTIRALYNACIKRAQAGFLQQLMAF